MLDAREERLFGSSIEVRASSIDSPERLAVCPRSLENQRE
jgi:hypothetical protein